MEKESRVYVTRFNRERIMALRAEMNAGAQGRLLTQDDAVSHLFNILHEFRKQKKEIQELKNRLTGGAPQ